MQLTELEAHRHSIATRSGEISYIDIDPVTPEGPVGTGPVALFVHGIATNAFLWRNVIGALTHPATLHRRRPPAARPQPGDRRAGPVRRRAGGGPGGLLRRARAHRHRSRRQRHRRGHRPDLRRPPPAAAGLAHPDRLRHRRQPAARGVQADGRAGPSRGPGADRGGAVRRPRRRRQGRLRHRLRAPGPGRPGGHPLLPGAVLRHAGARPGVRKAAGRPGRRPTWRRSRLSSGSSPCPRCWCGAPGTSFFDVSWAYWLRDTIPGTTQVVTVDGARLFFPDERAMDLVPHLEQHWAAAAAVRA